MWSTLVILHDKNLRYKNAEIPDFVSWHTCMRSIYISDERLLNVDFFSVIGQDLDVYRGFKAYSFLLEIVCGLHSKLFGESEVQAQFKDRFSEERITNLPLSHFLLKLKNQILEHSKIIRSSYLTGIGRQSYGGLCEKYIHNQIKVHLFGTGNLAESLLPYLVNNEREVILYGRNDSRMDRLKRQFVIKTKYWDEYKCDTQAVIIASSVFPESMFSKISKSAMIIDFREKDFSKVSSKNINYIPFHSMLLSIHDTTESISLLKPQVFQKIDQLTHLREDEQLHIMNGWEDLPQVCY